jgi:HAD superfamily hydrolase (TIGR01459 family)
MSARLGPSRVLGVAALAERYETFLVDQFGVLHDGNAAYPGAIEALLRLKAAGKRVVLLSNSGKRAAPNEERLRRLGFPDGAWDLFLSSGEVAWRIFSGLEGEAPLAPGTSCLLLVRDGDRTAVEGLNLELADDGADADLVLIAGSEGDRFPLGHYRCLLEPAARTAVPCFCTNPDRIMLTASGPRFGAGRIAELYEELGGVVRRIGKPHPQIYRTALATLGDPPVGTVLCIGDSVEHDLVGAKQAGLASALVRSGILAGLPEEALSETFARYHAAPDLILSHFSWTC